MKFTRTSISITLERVDNQALLKVADDGIGIQKTSSIKSGTVFIRSRILETNRSIGVGLGLSFVKDIAELHRANLIFSLKKMSAVRLLFVSLSD
ncbi:MAG: ATP-binding protein [Streptococcus salivarius]